MSAMAQPSMPLLACSPVCTRGAQSPKWIDEEHYRAIILQLPHEMTETDIDRRLKHEASKLDIPLLQMATNVHAQIVTDSFSANDLNSEFTRRGSILSILTSPELDSASDIHPVTSLTEYTEPLPLSSTTPSILTDMEKKRKSGFRNGIRKMTGFGRKGKSPNHSSPILGRFSSRSRTEIGSTTSMRDMSTGSTDFDLKGCTAGHLALKPPSLQSNKSSSVWSNKRSETTKSSFDHGDALIDHDALQRTMECPELVSLRTKQTEERQRFLDYQAQTISSIRAEKDQKMAEKRRLHSQMVEEQMQKNDRAIEDLESRQLEDELKMVQDHEIEKRAIVARLRHMEAYCQNPSPPSTPIEFNFSDSDGTSSPTSIARGSIDSNACMMVYPERKVTDKDYHSLASCYRERDAMDNLHASKINVLRGKQKRAVENFIAKKEKEIKTLEARQTAEMDNLERDCGVEEAECRAEFWEKRTALEKRWKLQTMIEKAKIEFDTGLKYEVLPPLTLTENDAAGGHGAAK